MAADKSRILLLDDSKLTRQFLRAVLEMKGFAVSEAQTIREALTLARRDAPDLLILDLILQQELGLDLVGQLRQEAALSELPILFLTGDDDPLRRETIRRTPHSAFLPKPPNVDRLLATVQSLLKPAVGVSS